jgi:tRNA (cytidine/uridine-2'-O-)-methyltransferase
VRAAFFEPDIPQNAAAAIRLCACLDVPLAIIEPCGFVWDERRLRRVGLDYLSHVALARHAS